MAPGARVKASGRVGAGAGKWVQASGWMCVNVGTAVQEHGCNLRCPMISCVKYTVTATKVVHRHIRTQKEGGGIAKSCGLTTSGLSA